jgi:iduronate 2-sulfatase
MPSEIPTSHAQRFIRLILAAALLSASLAHAERANVLFIAIDDLRNDLGVYGAGWAKTPHLDAFAATARPFSHHYVQVPTCGASRLALLRGRRASRPVHLSNSGIRDTASEWSKKSLPGIFRSAGYRTLALGKISHHPGGLTGRNWDKLPEELPGVWDRQWIPDGPWEHPVAIMHGYANGVARVPGKSLPIEAFDGPDDAYPDAWVAKDAITTLQELADADGPWFFSVGFFKPHLPFAAPKKYFDLFSEGVPDLDPEVAKKREWRSGWHSSGEFRRNYGHAGRDPDNDPAYVRELRVAYAASTSYVDAQVGRVLAALEEKGLAENTIVVIWSDHGFLLGEHAIWGKHNLYEHSLRCPLMIRKPGMAKAGVLSNAIVETVDLLPTLADLCGLTIPEGLDGVSLRPQLENPAAAASKPAIGHWTGGQRTVRDERWRLIISNAEGHVELFDYENDPGETRNLAAEQPERVREMMKLLE